MIKHLEITVLFLVLCVTPWGAAEDWMPDSALRAAVREKLRIPEHAPLTPEYVQEHLRNLEAISKGITDLRGLEHATDLHALVLAQNKIRDLSPLSGLTELFYLNLGSNQISDIRPLAGLTRLEVLGLSDNRIEDLSPLTGLVNLKDLNINGNPIMQFRPFENSQVYFDDLLDVLRCEMPRLLVENRIEDRTYPSVFAFGNIINLRDEDEGVLYTYHDLHIAGLRFGMRWYETQTGERWIIGNSRGGQNARREMLARNPNMLLLSPVNLGADPGVHPQEWPYWLRDKNGDIIYEEGWNSYVMDITLPAVQDRAVQQVISIEKCGYDGIFLDLWNEKDILDRVAGRIPPDNEGIFRGVENEFEARMTILRRIREVVGDDFLILVNSNENKVPHSAPYVNGMFMETVSSPFYGYTHQQLSEIESTLLWGEQALRSPQINCLRGAGLPSEPLDSPKNQQWMRVFTTLSLTHSDGYVVYVTGIEFNYHTHEYEIWEGHSEVHARGAKHSHNQEHYWYPFYDAPLGYPVGGNENKGQLYENREGVFIREFTNGWAVYNRSGKAQLIELPEKVRGVASGVENKLWHTLPDLDGEIFLKRETGTSADVNGDGTVNVLDLVAVANAFGKHQPDINGDGVVNILDLVAIANAFE